MEGVGLAHVRQDNLAGDDSAVAGRYPAPERGRAETFVAEA